MAFSGVTANAATPVSTPIGINLYSLGSPDADFSSFTATPTGWVLIGTIPAEVTGASWNIPTTLGGDDLLVAAVDLNGKPLWANRIGTTSDDAGLLVAADNSGNIWTVGVSTAAQPPSTPAGDGLVNPDAVPTLGDDEGGNGPNQLLVSQLSPTGQMKVQTSVAAPLGVALQPTKVLVTGSGVVVVGTAATDETGAVRGFITTLDNQLQSNTVFIGASSTSITDAELTPNGIQIAGASSEILAKKAPLGLRDAYTATWSNNTLSGVIRSGAKGVDRSWTSMTATKEGFLFVGWAETKGKIETIATSLTKVGKVLFSNRYPASDDQFVFSGNRLALTTKTASTFFPGWKPAGIDAVILTLDAKGKTTALMTVAGPGSEELIAVSPKAILGRTSGSLPRAVGQGTILLARIAR